jgi:hypothetical protein
MFRFPRSKFTDSTTIDGQVAHCASELVEIMAALADGEPTERVVEEIIDAMHSLETLLRKFQEGGCDIERAANKVIRKNHVRGYYA